MSFCQRKVLDKRIDQEGNVMVAAEREYQPGDWVVYRKTKYSTQPGPRAQNVSPAQGGDKYAYTVDKFWVVAEILNDGRLVLQTRRGKEHVLDASDYNLHRARWWERLLYRRRFAAVQQPAAPTV